MGRRIVSGGCHLAERKNGDFAALGDCHPTERSWMEVGRIKSLSCVCTTTPYPTVGWPPVIWKGSGTHVSLSVQAA
ncbi:unnamed protein product [Spirodela intermedia]|uniref:Uncharacterized protein n=1 Tax=Spirodela intermedia TaxID=51605 RepID=A0A7I8IK57_SPIIN|nr:unnamed protein product [Spirodela intermedia]CAA6658272.1 unnamed protein product [Spirodela intermedia]